MLLHFEFSALCLAVVLFHAGYAELQCPTVDAIVAESWLEERSGPYHPNKAPPIPDYKTKHLRFKGTSLKTCSEQGRPVDTVRLLSPGNPEIRVCIPDPRTSHFSYPFWSTRLGIAAAEEKGEEGHSRSRLASKACLTCFALAKPPKPGTFYESERKASVTMVTQLACGRRLQTPSGEAFYGPRKEDAEQLRSLREAIGSCEKTPSCAPSLPARIAQFQAAYKQFTHTDADLDEVPAVKHRQEIPLGHAQVLQSEVEFGPDGGILSGFSLGAERCSAFEWGLVVMGPGEARAACWLTPSWAEGKAQTEFQDSVREAQTALVVPDRKARRAAAADCRRRYAEHRQRVEEAAATLRSRLGDGDAAAGVLRWEGRDCAAFCAAAKKLLPAGASFLTSAQAWPHLCRDRYLPLKTTADEALALRRD